MTPGHREALRAPSEWDLILSPELGPFFVVEAAIVTAHHFLSIQLDPSSSLPGGANHPPTLDLLRAMRTLRKCIRHHRLIAEAFTDTPVTGLQLDDHHGPPRDEGGDPAR